MISAASTKSRLQRTARSSGLLVLEPPRHTHLPLAFLQPGKHLIGTSDVCAIRVVAEGVEPRHAMLLVGDQMILLKALDPRTWVNDGVVTETTLRLGDRISIGPITYKLRLATADELLDFNAAEIEAHTPAVPTEPVQAAAPQQLIPQFPPPIPPDLLAESMRPIPLVQIAEVPAPTVASAPKLVVATPVIEPTTVPSVTEPTAPSAATPVEPTEISPVISEDLPAPVVRLEPEPAVVLPEPALREIHRQIAMLSDASVVVDRSREDARLVEERKRLHVKETELTQLAEELSRQAQRLRDRHNQLSERESAHDRKQSLLTQEQERLVTAAQATRHDLAEEHGRQKALWQEWDAAYRRTADDLRDQLECVEQRRGAFQLEAERIAESRAELQRLREDFERDRRVAASERVQAAQELGEWHSQRAAFETERRHYLVETQERETQLASERHVLAMLQEELLSSQQKMEIDRTAFAAERSAESRQREQEVREQTQTRIRLNDEETSLHSIRLELETDRRSFEQEREILRRERESFDAERSAIGGLRTELSQVKCELDLHRQAIDDHLRVKRTADEQLEQLQAELEGFRRSKKDLESKLESERRELQRERNEYDVERAEVGGLLLEVESLRRRKQVLESELETERRELQRERNESDFDRVDTNGLQTEVHSLRRRKLVLESELESERRELQRERNESDFERVDVDGLQAEVERLVQRKRDLESQLESERRDLQRERNAIEFERVDLNQLQVELKLARAEILDKEQGAHEQSQSSDAVDSEVVRLHAEIEALRQSDNQLRLQLDAERNQRELDRESFMATREELNSALAAAQSAQDRFVEPYSHVDTTSGSGTHVEWHRGSIHPSMHEVASAFSPEVPYESLAGSMPLLPPPIPTDSQCSTGSIASGTQFSGDNVQSVAPSQQVGLGQIGESVNWQAESTPIETQETKPNLESDVPRSVQSTLVKDEGVIPTDELPSHQNEDAVARRVIETIDSTLSGVTQFFETNAPTQASNPTGSSSFERAPHDLNYHATPEAIEPARGIESAFRRGPNDDDLSLPSLRAQLAQMFDLPEAPSFSQAAEPAGQQESATTSARFGATTDDRVPSVTDEDMDRGQATALTIEAEAISKNAADSGEGSTATTGDSEEENAWTRRLRELSQLVSHESSPASTPATPAAAERVAASPETEANDSEVDEYSVEAQLARLLGKPRASQNPVTPATTTESVPEQPRPFAVYVPPTEPVPEYDVEDRSHLMAEPRHRQNKNAIREEVQSFREVAQMSARTALAKHTWDNLRNEFYMTSALTSAAVIATAWYVGSFVFGTETESWKGIACGLAALLSSQRLLRASKQLNQWRRKNLLRTSTHKAPAPPLSLVVDAAASDANEHNPPKDGPNDK